MLQKYKPADSQRERAKNQRRQRIVDAACALLRERGMEAVSMNMIAERAHVSPGTLYNLFGTRGAVLAQVFDQDLQAFEAKVSRAHAAHSLDRMFKAIGIAARLYKSDPGFYRATMYMKSGPLDGEIYSAMRRPRIGFWCGMLEKVKAEGFLKTETNCAILGVLLAQITTGSLAEWVSNSISADQLERETSYGFALALFANATAAGQKDLSIRIHKLEKALASTDRHKGISALVAKPDGEPPS